MSPSLHVLRRWLKTNLFSDAFNTGLTLVLLAAAIAWLPPLLQWSIFNAQFKPDAAASR